MTALSDQQQRVVSDTLAWMRHTVPSVFADRRDLHVDSRRVQQGDVFVGVPGETVDGRDYLSAAKANGAVAAIVEAEGWSARSTTSAPIAVRAVDGLQELMGPLAADFYRHPSEHLLSIGVTGTNGKTSSTQWIAQLLTGAGRRCAVIGTIGIGFTDGPLREASLTTPDPVSLQREVRALLDAGARALAMEVSSIGLQQGRMNGMKVDVALFTNLSRDHLDFHGTMQRYEEAKALLFEWPTLSHAVINIDDAAGQRLIPRLLDRGVDVIGYSATSAALGQAASFANRHRLSHLLTAQRIRATANGLAFDATLDDRSIPVEVSLVGNFNVENLLGVLGVMRACGIDFEPAVAALPQLTPPTGRMQQVSMPDAPLVVVDYAHTPDALAKALDALRPLVEARSQRIGAGSDGKLWVVFGAGGDRDPGKREPMGAAAAAAADVVLITSDNSRGEDGHAICEQLAEGAAAARALITIADRGAAIQHAIQNAAPADVVLIAGKGHETYQLVGGQKLPFSDIAHAHAALGRRATPAKDAASEASTSQSTASASISRGSSAPEGVQ